MSAIARTDTSLVGRWWWTIDRWTLAALGTIIAIGRKRAARLSGSSVRPA